MPGPESVPSPLLRGSPMQTHRWAGPRSGAEHLCSLRMKPGLSGSEPLSRQLGALLCLLFLFPSFVPSLLFVLGPFVSPSLSFLLSASHQNTRRAVGREGGSGCSSRIGARDSAGARVPGTSGKKARLVAGRTRSLLPASPFCLCCFNCLGEQILLLILCS